MEVCLFVGNEKGNVDINVENIEFDEILIVIIVFGLISFFEDLVRY